MATNPHNEPVLYPKSTALRAQSGPNRYAGPCSIAATNDIEAVLLFIKEYAHAPETQKTYLKHCRRLLKYAYEIAKKPLSGFNRQDFQAFEDFVTNPSTDWCGPKVRYQLANGSVNPKWRPFAGPLDPVSVEHMIACINALMNWLVKAGYLDINPLLLRRKPRVSRSEESRRIKHEAFDQDLVQELWRTLDNRPRHSKPQRDDFERVRFMLSCFCTLGLRIGELVTHTMGDFRLVQDRWRFYVQGKGRSEKDEWLPVNEDLLVALRRYRGHLGLAPYPAPDEDKALVLNRAGRFAIGKRQLHNLVKALFVETAERILPEKPHAAMFLARTAAHGLRHYYISTLGSMPDIGLGVLMKLARHKNPATTGVYLKSSADERYRVANQLKIK